MSNDIVRYSNDLNRINLAALSEQENNLLFSVLLELKDRGTEPITFTATQLAEFVFKNVTLKELTAVVTNLKKNFFSLNFNSVIDFADGSCAEEFVNLFEHMRIVYDRDKTDPDRLVKSLELKVSAACAYMLNDLTKGFTKFELAEFVSLQSKYSKTLFRLLKQFRTQGWVIFEWEDFKERMGIPASYRMRDIDVRILKPAVKELNWDGGKFDLFKDYHGCDHPTFKNLRYEKIRSKTGKGRGVTEIRFYFDKEAVPIDYRKKYPTRKPGQKHTGTVYYDENKLRLQDVEFQSFVEPNCTNVQGFREYRYQMVEMFGKLTTGRIAEKLAAIFVFFAQKDKHTSFQEKQLEEKCRDYLIKLFKYEPQSEEPIRNYMREQGLQ